MKKIILIGISSLSILSIIGGLNTTNLNGVDVKKTSTVKASAINIGSATNSGVINTSAGKINIQAGSSVGLTNTLTKIDIVNNGKLVAKSTNTGSASNGGVINTSAGQFTLQSSGTIASESTLKNTDVVNRGILNVTAKAKAMAEAKKNSIK